MVDRRLALAARGHRERQLDARGVVARVRLDARQQDGRVAEIGGLLGEDELRRGAGDGGS
jgi:hypothetical protein